MNKDLAAAPLSRSVRAEAAVWATRLHGSGRTRALEAGLRKWLAADPAHARAFELATEAWEMGGGLPARTDPRSAGDSLERPSRRWGAARSWALAASACLAVVAVVFYVKNPPAIVTSVGEQRMLTLADGTRIFVNSDSRLVVRVDARQRHVRLESGEAMFDVAKDPKRPFSVVSAGQEVVALGTSFMVRRDVHRLSVTLMEGAVTVAPVDTFSPERTVLTPGQRLTVEGSSPPMLDTPPLDQVMAWRRGEVVLDNAKLQDAIDEMNRYSTVKLRIADPEVADIRISGVFRSGDSVPFARGVSATYGLAVTYSPDEILIAARANQH
ncbi:MAG: FecR family protein [Pseudomonadota bacterium]|nr:FecR family protein [Pseudomonadota bacterium]